jgi:A/G-specific adenine glycosylase
MAQPRQTNRARIRARLLRWFDRKRRDLPWRRTRNPYRIWLAEIMLQQTRVPVVVPYYERFLKAFPTVEKLARAPEERVLRLWAGLGYYQRARHLHRAAKEIVRRHAGRFPSRLEEALALPGVGAYTARAVLSIAYRRSMAVVDGNVARALARLLLLLDADDRSRLQPVADRLVSRRRPGDFNQALMELGSTICLPRIPRCTDCPLEALCAARQQGRERTIPRRRKKRARPQVKLRVFVVHHNGCVLVLREPRGYFSGLWHFPYTAGRRLASLGPSVQMNGTHYCATLTHQTTMRDLILRVYLTPARRAAFPAKAERRWVRPAQLNKLGVGAATRKIADAVRAHIE